MISFDPDKRTLNMEKHGLDLVIAERALSGFTLTREDTRERYGEIRLQTLGEVDGMVVAIVHPPRDQADHIISVRKAERYEARYYWKNHPDGH